MRLKQRDIDAIKWAALQVFGGEARVSLYGSRLRDDLRGGDIDLLIDVGPGRGGLGDVVAFKRCLFDRIDEQKVDLAFRVRGEVPAPFVEMIAPNAVALP